MPTGFIETLHAWQNFYFMMGGAATLIGLLFVALSLGGHLVSAETDEAFDAFVTPILVYFVSVLLLVCGIWWCGLGISRAKMANRVLAKFSWMRGDSPTGRCENFLFRSV